MHNTPEDNLRFQITDTENSIRWLLGETPRNERLIAQHRSILDTLEADLKQLLETGTCTRRGCIYVPDWPLPDHEQALPP